jgi:hypothetical protein
MGRAVLAASLVVLGAPPRPAAAALAAGWSSEVLDASAPNPPLQAPQTVVYGRGPHVFDIDAAGHLRHQWYDGAWRAEGLDPATTLLQPSGGGGLAVIQYGTQLHAFYPATDKALHHAWWDGSRWKYELLPAEYDDDQAGYRPSAIVYRGQLHVFYLNDYGTMNLGSDYWDGRRWTVVDIHVQEYASWTPSSVATKAVLYNGLPRVYFTGFATFSTGNGWPVYSTGLYEATWSGTQWSSTTLDSCDADPRDAELSARCPREYQGVSVVAALHQLHVFYGGASALHHQWLTGSTWAKQDLPGGSVDGSGDPVPVINPAALVVDGLPQVWAVDAAPGSTGPLRRTFYDGHAWGSETFDSTPVDAPAVVTFNQPHIFAGDTTAGIDHSWR